MALITTRYLIAKGKISESLILTGLSNLPKLTKRLKCHGRMYGRIDPNSRKTSFYKEMDQKTYIFCVFQ